MNSLKSLFVVTLLAAAACGVYVSLNRKPDSGPPPGAPQEAVAPPKLDGVPPIGGATDQNPPGTAATNATGGAVAPAFGSSPRPNNTADTSAPPYYPPGGAGSGTNSGALAPPYGTTASSDSTAPPFSPSRNQPDAAKRDSFAGKAGNTSLPADNQGRFGAPPGPNSASEGTARSKFDAVMKSVGAAIDAAGTDPPRLAEAHLALSQYYMGGEVPPEQAANVLKMLDQLAATVIYSRHYHLEPPYRVQPGDTLDRIAGTYQIPPQVLARINGIRDLQNLPPGRELKVVRGPFNAFVDLDKFELTLLAKGRYAGRFPIGVGLDQPRLEGTYIVQDKKLLPAYEGRSGVIAPADPNNPLGKYLIDLGNQVGIHGTNNPQGVRRAENRGTICLGDRDIDDVFGILSVGSRVVIQR